MADQWLAPALLTSGGVLHVAVLVALGLPGRARPATPGDAAFLITFGALYVIAASGLRRGRRWGRWLALTVSGLEAVPAGVLFYVLLVFSGDPAGRGSFEQIGFMALLLVPMLLFIIVWRHVPRGRPEAAGMNHRPRRGV